MERFVCSSVGGGSLSLPEGCGDDDLRRCIRLVQSEYFEMPGLHLTREQMQRLWGLDDRCCNTVLGALERSNFLRRTARDAYVRADVSV